MSPDVDHIIDQYLEWAQRQNHGFVSARLPRPGPDTLTDEQKNRLRKFRVPAGIRAVWQERGHLDALASIGGYPLYYVDYENVVACAKCAGRALADLLNADEPDEYYDPTNIPVAYGVHYEGPPLICDGCGTQIESAYGDPDATEDEE